MVVTTMEVYAIGIQCWEARDSKCPAMHRTVPPHEGQWCLTEKFWAR